MTMKCKVPSCGSKSIHLRGLCRSCYIFASSLVFFELTTWGQLEASACVDATVGQKQSPKRVERTSFFAAGVGMAPEILQNELRRRTHDYALQKQKERLQKRGK